jgi:hypothetical protein
MQTTYTVQHNEHSTTRPFDDVIQAFEGATGSIEGLGLPRILASAKTLQDFEEQIRQHEGSS